LYFVEAAPALPNRPAIGVSLVVHLDKDVFDSSSSPASDVLSRRITPNIGNDVNLASDGAEDPLTNYEIARHGKLSLLFAEDPSEKNKKVAFDKRRFVI
jgi:hypothetical protein